MVTDMDLDELIRNIQTARDAARDDSGAFRAQAAELRGSGKTGEMMGATIAATAAEAVEVALSRILGASRARVAPGD